MCREIRGRFRREGIYICIWLIHVEVWQKTTKFCKAIILKLKKHINLKRSCSFWVKVIHSLENNNLIWQTRCVNHSLPIEGGSGWPVYDSNTSQKHHVCVCVCVCVCLPVPCEERPVLKAEASVLIC